MSTQPEALRLADRLSTGIIDREGADTLAAVAELRRLHEVNAELLAALKDTHALLQATLLIINDAEARAIAKQQLEANRAAIAKATGGQQ